MQGYDQEVKYNSEIKQLDFLLIDLQNGNMSTTRLQLASIVQWFETSTLQVNFDSQTKHYSVEKWLTKFQRLTRILIFLMDLNLKQQEDYTSIVQAVQQVFNCSHFIINAQGFTSGIQQVDGYFQSIKKSVQIVQYYLRQIFKVFQQWIETIKLKSTIKNQLESNKNSYQAGIKSMNEKIQQMQHQNQNLISAKESQLDQLKTELQSQLSNSSHFETLMQKIAIQVRQKSVQIDDLLRLNNSINSQLIKSKQQHAITRKNWSMLSQQVFKLDHQARELRNENSEMEIQLATSKQATLIAKQTARQMTLVNQQLEQQIERKNKRMYSQQELIKKYEKKFDLLTKGEQTQITKLIAKNKTVEENNQKMLTQLTKQAQDSRLKMISQLQLLNIKNNTLLERLHQKELSQKQYKSQISALKQKEVKHDNLNKELKKKNIAIQAKMSQLQFKNQNIVAQNEQLATKISSSNIQLSKVRSDVLKANEISKKLEEAMNYKDEQINKSLQANQNLRIVYLTRQRQYLVTLFKNIQQRQINSILRDCLNKQFKQIKSDVYKQGDIHKRNFEQFQSKIANIKQNLETQVAKNKRKTLGGARYATSKLNAFGEELFKLKEKDDQMKMQIQEIQAKMLRQARMKIPSQRIKLQTQDYLKVLFG